MSLEVLFLRFVLSSFGVDYDVIHVNRGMSCGYSQSENRIHYHLEGCGGVGESKEHHSWFEQSFQGEKRCFPFVPWFDSDVIVSPANVDFGE